MDNGGDSFCSLMYIGDRREVCHAVKLGKHADKKKEQDFLSAAKML